MLSRGRNIEMNARRREGERRKEGKGGRGRGGQARAVYSLLTRQKRFMPATIATTSAIKTATAATNKNVIKIKQK